MKILFIAMIFFNSPFICSSEKHIDSVKNSIMIDELYKNPDYRNWIEFWKSKIPEVEDFILEKTYTIERKYSSKIDLEKWFNEREYREFTLDFSPKKNYVTDIYSHVGFEFKNDSIYVIGGDVDPSFVIVNIKDSVLYYLTFGPYSFFDESIWLSDSICYILGFSFDDSRQNVSEAYSKIIILKWDFNKDSLVVNNSQKLPFKNELMSFRTYMDYVYPNFSK